MEDELLPESIRGGWYFVPSGADLEETLDGSAEVLVFTLDGEFDRWTIEERTREHEEHGEYTFDGQFLIVRGGDTNTYRVQPEQPWRWYLEAKKDDHLLLRGWTDRAEPLELGEERLNEIESVPARVFVRSDFGGPDDGEICSLIHESDGEELRLGACYAELRGDDVRWVGLTPFTRSLSETLWRRILRRSYLEIYREDDPGDVDIDILT